MVFILLAGGREVEGVEGLVRDVVEKELKEKDDGVRGDQRDGDDDAEELKWWVWGGELVMG